MVTAVLELGRSQLRLLGQHLPQPGDVAGVEQLAAVDLGQELRPADEAVLTGHGSLGSMQDEAAGDRADSPQRFIVAVLCGAQQILGLVTQLLDVRSGG